MKTYGDLCTKLAKQLAKELGQNQENLRGDLINGASVEELREFYQQHDPHNSHENGLAYI